MRRLCQIEATYLLLALIGTPEAAVATALGYVDLQPHVTTSENGEFYFVMIPESDRDTTAGGSGSMYKIVEGEDWLFYTTRGWFAHEVFVSSDGKSLAVPGTQYPDTPPFPFEKGAALSFFRLGILIKEYSAADLAKGSNKPERGAGHQHDSLPWISWAGDSRPNQIRVRAADGGTLFFDIETGKRTTDVPPRFSEWGLIALGSLLLVTVAISIRRWGLPMRRTQ
jgi:hypothetical protein